MTMFISEEICFEKVCAFRVVKVFGKKKLSKESGKIVIQKEKKFLVFIKKMTFLVHIFVSSIHANAVSFDNRWLLLAIAKRISL